VGSPDNAAETAADHFADSIAHSPSGVDRAAANPAGPSPGRDGGFSVPPGFEASLNASGIGTALSPESRQFFEPRLGADLEHVRVHTSAKSARLARSIGARAFTLGSDIHFAGGEWNPESQHGRRLLAHELAHVVQQRADSTVRRQPGPRCTSVRMSLPNRIIFEGTGGRLEADLQTDIAVSGEAYELTYDLADDRFVISPWPTSDVILNVSLDQRPQSDIDLYRHYRDSLAGSGAPLTITAGDASAEPAAQEQPAWQFMARPITPDELRQQYGLDASQIPAQGIVPVAPQMIGPPLLDAFGASVGPAGLGPMAFLPTPMSMVPANSTGFLWTQGHLSLFSTPGGTATIVGYRGNLGWYASEYLTEYSTFRLLRGVPGRMYNDALFPNMSGQQVAIYVERTQPEAARFAERIGNAEYGGEYRYSPPRPNASGTEARMYERLHPPGQPEGVMCTNNCITVPSAEVEAAVGGRPRLTLADGREIDLMTGAMSDGTVDPHRAGRASDMSRYAREGELPPGAQRISFTPRAANAVGVIRVGGGLMLIYGAVRTTQRLTESYGTEQFRHNVGEEAGAWSLGLLGSALGAGVATATAAAVTGATGGAVVCAPGGPVDLACVLVGAAGGLIGGFVFGTAGALIGGEIADQTR
jgi:hypothetical protein